MGRMQLWYLFVIALIVVQTSGIFGSGKWLSGGLKPSSLRDVLRIHGGGNKKVINLPLI